eukprot:6179601-Pleurochrysis_carterae.AAC.3
MSIGCNAELFHGHLEKAGNKQSTVSYVEGPNAEVDVGPWLQAADFANVFRPCTRSSDSQSQHQIKGRDLILSFSIMVTRMAAVALPSLHV